MLAATTLIARVDALTAQSRVQDAYHLLMTEARAESPAALAELAAWFLSGQHVPRDLARARTLFGEAGKRGDRHSRRIHINFVANGAGGAPDPAAARRMLKEDAASDSDAARQLALLAAMPAEAPPEPEPVHASPAVSIARAAFTADECAYLAEVTAARFQPAGTVDPQTGRIVRDPIRTSDLAAFPLVDETPVVHAINRRLAALAELPVDHGEPLQILRYRPGQEYKLHSDALPGVSNQRVATALIYLNADYDGGATAFPRLDWSFRGNPGDVLIFRSVGDDGRPDPRAVHAGLPVTTGEKLIASRWMRERPIDLLKPLSA